jgi:hypothetical protein
MKKSLPVINRRNFLKITSISPFVFGVNSYHGASPQSMLAPVRKITKGPKFHWFGYYDKLQFDPTGRYVLGMQVDFEHRTPTADDIIKIGIIDLQEGDRWTEIGTSNAWGWQQGCMLQWVPKSNSEIIWNNRIDNQFVSHIYHVKTGLTRTLSKAIYTISPNGKWAIGTEFSRIQDLRPGYGYAGIPDPYADEKTPKDIGLYKIDLKTGKSKMLFSIADIAKIPSKGKSVEDQWHWFNHLLVSPDSKRFLFLNRWRAKKDERQKMAIGGFVTRMFTCDSNGKDLYCIDPSGFSSHFVWKNDSKQVCVYTKPEGQEDGFYEIEDKTGKFRRIGKEKMPTNGHQTYLPVGNKMDWILNDNYPNRDRLQTLYLYHIPTDKRIDLGQFRSPIEYKGEWRCDLHPRFSPDGKKVVIDSPHEGNGRQMYLIDIENLI